MAELFLLRNLTDLCDGFPGNISRDANESNKLWRINNNQNPAHKTSAEVTAAFLLLIAVLALPGNLLLAGVILKEKLFKQPTILLLLNLAITDLLQIFLILPFQIATGIQGEFIAGQSDYQKCIACDVGLITETFAIMSIFTVAFISFDRFLFIYKPLHYYKIITSTRVLIVLIVMWTVAAVVSILPIVGLGEMVFFPPVLTCTVNYSLKTAYWPIITTTILSLAIVFMMVCNIWVLVIVLKNIRAVYQTMKSTSNKKRSKEEKDFNKQIKKKRHHKELHTIRVFGCLMLSSIITWLPLVCVSAITFISAETHVYYHVPAKVFSAVHVLFASQVLLHPLVEIALIQDVRKPIKKLLRLCCCCRKKQDSFAKSKSVESSPSEANHLGSCSFLAMLEASFLHHHATPESHTSEHNHSHVDTNV